jgi:hypothetical protein
MNELSNDMNERSNETVKADRYQAWLMAIKPPNDEEYTTETFEDYIR